MLVVQSRLLGCTDSSEHHTRRRENLKSHMRMLVAKKCGLDRPGPGWRAVTGLCVWRMHMEMGRHYSAGS
jgi:hypothetical protein